MMIRTFAPATRMARLGRVRPHWIPAFAVATATVVATAAPTLMKPKVVADEIVSTADIESVRLAINPLPKMMTTSGITQEQIEQIAEQALDDAGYAVTTSEKDNSPKLAVTVLTAVSDELKDAVAVTATIDVHQDVAVHRINMDLTVPTMTIVIPNLVPRQSLGRRVPQQVREAFNLLLQTFDKATDAKRNREL